MTIKVQYTGTEPLQHRTGTWAPGEIRDMNSEAGMALVQERGDMVSPPTAVKVKPSKQIAAAKGADS